MVGQARVRMSFHTGIDRSMRSNFFAMPQFPF